MAIDFGKYGSPTTKSSASVDFSKYGVSTGEQPVAKPTSFDIPETKVSKQNKIASETSKLKAEDEQANSFNELWTRPISDVVLTGTASLGDTLSSIKNTNSITDEYTHTLQILSDSNFNLLKKIHTESRSGKDTTKLKQIYNSNLQILADLEDEYKSQTKSVHKTDKQVAGELGMTALNILTAGTYGKATSLMKTGVLTRKAPTAIKETINLIKKPSGLMTKKGLTNVGVGGAAGYGFDVTANLQEGDTGAEIFNPGFGTLLGAGIPTITGLTSSIKNKLSGATTRSELGKMYTKIAGQYNQSQSLLNRSKLTETDPIGVLEMYGGKTVPEMGTNGKVDPTESIGFLKNKIGEFSNLKNEALFVSDKKVSIPDLRKYSMDLIDGMKSWTELKKLEARNEVEKIIKSLEKAYKNSPKNFGGLELSVLDQIKTEQTGLSKSYNNKSPKFNYDSHSIVGKGARDLIELMTDDQSVKDLNKLIQSHYDAIELLGSWKGKTPMGGMLSKRFMQLGGDIIGGMVGGQVGQPLVGAVTGHLISTRISNIIQSKLISNPVKRLLINNLKEQAPKEVESVLKTLESKYKDIFEEMGLPQSFPKSQSKTSPIIAPAMIDNTNPISKGISNTVNKVKATVKDLKNVAKNEGQKGSAELFTNKGSAQEQSLLNEAKKYKNAEEFVKKIQGSATQYGDYIPKLRKYGMGDYKNITELGVPPDKMVTIYRGIDDTTGKIPKKINDGDFVTTDYDSAWSYAGDNKVASMEVPAKTLYTDAIDDFKGEPFYTGSEYVYTKEKVTPMSESQLTDIWNKANNQVNFNPSTSYLKRNIEVLNKNGIKVKSPDEVITLYHGTNEAGVKGISESGSLKPSSFLATDPNASKGFVFGKGGKVLKIQVRVKDLGFVQDGGMAGSKGVSIQTIDPLVKGKDGIYYANKKTKLEAFGKVQIGALTKVGIGTAVGAIGASAYNKLQDKYGTVNYTAPEKPAKQKVTSKQLGNVLMSLESSGGTNKKSADKGELKWLTGLTDIAIKDLKKNKIVNSIDVNNKKEVIDASVKYFQYYQKKHPELSPAEIYVDYYWRGAKSKKERQKKIDDFNNLIK